MTCFTPALSCRAVSALATSSLEPCGRCCGQGTAAGTCRPIFECPHGRERWNQARDPPGGEPSVAISAVRTRRHPDIDAPIASVALVAMGTAAELGLRAAGHRIEGKVPQKLVLKQDHRRAGGCGRRVMPLLESAGASRRLCRQPIIHTYLSLTVAVKCPSRRATSSWSFGWWEARLSS